MTFRRFSKTIATATLLFSAFLASANDTVRVLSIGNSLSVNAVESYLSDLARSAGIPLIIGNPYIGGCTLERHWQNVQDSAARYSYRKIMPNGEKTVTPDASLVHCITDEPWDYISFQQSSGLSGIPESYFPFLANLLEFTGKNAGNRDVDYMFFQTWAYDTDSGNKSFPNYGNDQDSMYRCIVRAVDGAMARAGIRIIIPAGTAIQNIRANLPGEAVTRDGLHLNDGLGEFTASCIWFEALFGRIGKNRFSPEKITEKQAGAAKKAAALAARYPNETTSFDSRRGKRAKSSIK